MNVYKNILVSHICVPANCRGTRTSSSVDMQGFKSLSVVFSLGQSGDSLSDSRFWTLKLMHSDDDATFVDVPSCDLISGIAIMVINRPSLDEAVYHFGYKGCKRYVRAVASATGAHGVGTPMAVLALQGQTAKTGAEVGAEL